MSNRFKHGVHPVTDFTRINRVCTQFSFFNPIFFINDVNSIKLKIVWYLMKVLGIDFDIYLFNNKI